MERRSVKRLNSFREKLMRFMNGRYGSDQLNMALLVVYFLLFLVSMLTRTPAIAIAMWAVLICSMFRSFSRNIYARQKENRTFLKFWNPVKSKISLSVRRLREIQVYRFRRCAQCKTVLRLPRRTGRHMVRCPRCKHRFSVRVFF